MSQKQVKVLLERSIATNKGAKVKKSLTPNVNFAAPQPAKIVQPTVVTQQSTGLAFSNRHRKVK